MIKNLTLIKKRSKYYMDSREVALMLGKRHDHLLRDIRKYIKVIRTGRLPKIGESDFFVEDNYLNIQKKKMPCYIISKMGAEIIANKLTGEKGTLFTVAYVSKFNDMEARIRAEHERELLAKPSLEDCNNTAKIVITHLKRMGQSNYNILKFLNELYEPVGITVSKQGEFDDVPLTFTAVQLARIFSMYSLYGNPHAMAISCIFEDILFLDKKHKISVSENYQNGIIGRVRYDEYALEEILKWLDYNDYPQKIYGIKRSYKVIYATK